MTTGKQLLNKELISLTDGSRIGEIKDLYFDEKLLKIVAIYLGSEGLINKKHFAMDRVHVQLMGIDAWLVTSSAVSMPAELLPDSERLILYSSLRGREIITEGGTKIGAVDDVLLDEGGTIIGFGLGKIVVQGPLAERKVIAREAISTIGGLGSAMTANMALAETLQVSSV